MGNVYKNLYSYDHWGEELKKLVKKHKDYAEARAFSRYRYNPSFTKYLQPADFKNHIAGFRGGNDAMLIYIPNGNPRNQFRLYANSYVNDRKSPFALASNKFALIPKRAAIFDCIHTNNKREYGIGHYRSNDTEYKLLAHLSQRVNAHDQGKVYLFTSLEPCLSCDYVIIQFAKKHPHIKIRIYFEESYNIRIGEI